LTVEQIRLFEEIEEKIRVPALIVKATVLLRWGEGILNVIGIVEGGIKPFFCGARKKGSIVLEEVELRFDDFIGVIM
jgi:hypothetical protein